MGWMVCLLDMKEFENIELQSKIFIEDGAYHKLLSIIEENPRKVEIGGIIIGHYDTAFQNATVTEFTGPPEDSKAGRFRFYRGIKGLRNLLQQYWKERNEYYLGEWHLHPGSSPSPSYTDIEQMKKISKDKNFNCKEPILLIFGEIAKKQVTCLMIFKNGKMYSYKEKELEQK